MFGMADDKEPAEKVLIALSSAAITFKDSANSNLTTILVDSGASGHYFDDAIIRDLKRRLKGYVDLATPRTFFTAGEGLLDGTVEGVLLGLFIDNFDNQILVRVDIMVVPGTGRNLFSVMTVAKKSIVTSRRPT